MLAHADAFFVEHDRRRLISEPAARQLGTDYHREVLDAGANISVDCFGHRWNIAPNHWVIETDIDRVTGLVALIEAGYAAQLVLGTDICFKLLTRRGGGLGLPAPHRDDPPPAAGAGRKGERHHHHDQENASCHPRAGPQT